VPDVILAALVGGAIGLVAASIPLLWGLHYERYKRALNAHRDYLAWLRGIFPECEFIIACIDQLLPTYQAMLQPGAQLVCPTKRLNSDFLAAARLGVMKHPRSIILFPRLTDAYRDVVHGNDMMGRFEDRYQRVIGSPNAAAQLAGILNPTSQALPVVRGKVVELRDLALEQQQLEMDNAPTLSEWDPD